MCSLLKYTDPQRYWFFNRRLCINQWPITCIHFWYGASRYSQSYTANFRSHSTNFKEHSGPKSWTAIDSVHRRYI
uniref:Ovule protein n=1 Tax=Ascaris lumbricoides TaxID=6252 RepID=A0A0M3ILZ2_ASCLU